MSWWNEIRWIDDIRQGRVSAAYAVAIAGCAALSMASIGLSRLEHLAPLLTVLPPRVFGQALGLHRVLLHDFVLASLMPAVFGFALLPGAVGLQRLARPRLATAALMSFVAGGVLVLRALADGGIEPGWAYAAASPYTRTDVSIHFLAGLGLANVSLLLSSVVLLATMRRRRGVRAPLFCRSFYWASALALFGSALKLVTLVLAAAACTGRLDDVLPALATDPTGLARLSAWATSPLQAAMSLGIIGVVCLVLAPERRLSRAGTRLVAWQIALLAWLSPAALDTNELPALFSTAGVATAFTFRALSIAVLLGLATVLVRAACLRQAWREPAPLAALVALLLIVLFSPLDLLLSVPAAALFAPGYLSQAAEYLLLGGPALFAAAAGAFHVLRDADTDGLSFMATGNLLLGMAYATVPMLLMGPSGLRMDMAVYPAEFVVFQTLVLFGGGVFCVGLLATGAAVAVRAWRASPSLVDATLCVEMPEGSTHAATIDRAPERSTQR